ncbi:tumor necrosis factor-like [Lepisosteus oculatus]|uniref:tumor necrosis factor-like n=1 Tax=Lepisosteus oculatus TaxID=7918 RepID=UPI0035F516D9
MDAQKKQTLVDAERGAGVLVIRERPRRSRAWPACALLAVLALCAAGALLFAWYHTRGRQEEEAAAASEKRTGNELRQREVGETAQMLKQIASTKKAAIHLQGETSDDHSALQWLMDGQAFTQGGLSLHHNQVTVPRSGLYFVYTQASFRAACGPGSEALHLSHGVTRFSGSYQAPRPLLRAVRTVCGGGGGGGGEAGLRFSALYQGAVFSLEQGDTLSTHTSHLELLDDKEEGNVFFGVFEL